MKILLEKRNFVEIAAGILMYRRKPELEVFLVHPGGPFFKNKDSWSIPKGLVEEGENLKDGAIREFSEETGIVLASSSTLIPLGHIVQKSGKIVHAWAYENDFSGTIHSNMVDHPQFGKFPEVDQGKYFSVADAKSKIISGQIGLIDSLESHLKTSKIAEEILEIK